MSAPAGKLPLPELAEMKRRGEKIVMVTAYDAPGARFAEDAGIELILVGDTAAMVVLGRDGTESVTMDEMLFLTRTVAGAARRPVVIGDMPFGSFQVSDEKALENAIRFVKEAGADAVKLEGAGAMVSRVRTIVEAGHPRDGTRRPDAAVGDDARRLQDPGQDRPRRAALVDDALALEAAGASRVVLEAVPSPVAAEITRRLRCRRSESAPAARLRRPGARLPRPARADRGPSPPLRQALREPLARDPRRARGLRRGCALGRVPRRRAHLLDGRRRARELRATAGQDKPLTGRAPTTTRASVQAKATTTSPRRSCRPRPCRRRRCGRVPP